jgi:hypothetical protein
VWATRPPPPPRRHSEQEFMAARLAGTRRVDVVRTDCSLGGGEDLCFGD